MNKDELIKNVVYNDDNIVNVIKNAPQTYNSILQHLNGNGTMQLVLRRRVKRLVNQGRIWKMRVPGTRFGLVIFGIPDHDYKILVLNKIIGVKIYYMYELNDKDDYVIIDNYWELVDYWSKWEFNDTPLKIPKYTLRDGGFRLWE